MTEAAATPSRKALLGGLAFWSALGIAGVFLRGVRYEESLERVQAMLGITPYPEGHPLYVFACNAFSIHYPLSAWVLQLTGSEYAVCAFRDILYVLAMLLPVFLIATHLGRTTRAGHLAALLVFVNCPNFFSSFYNINMWPWTYTSGEIGMGWALFTFYAFLIRAWLPAGLLLGVMPIVHLGQMPPVLALAGIAGLALLVRKDHAGFLRLAAGVALGAIGCGLFYLYYRTQTVAIPTEGAYAPQGDPWDVWRRFTHYEDIHRRLTGPPRFGPFAESSIAVVALYLIGGLATWRGVANRDQREPWMLVTAYATLVGAIVWGIMLVHRQLGIDTPYLLIGWMPYRLTNHAALILLAATAAALTLDGPGKRAATICLFLGVLVFASQTLSIVTPGVLYTFTQRYVMLREAPLFFLVGAAALRAVLMLPRGRVIASVLVATAWLALAWTHQYMALCALAGGIALLVCLRLPKFAQIPQRRWLLATLLCGLTAALQVLVSEYISRKTIEEWRPPFIKALDERGEQDAMILAPFTRLNYQLEWRHPVFATFETRNFITYVPALAPTVERMFEEVYGVGFAGNWGWDFRETWASRTQAEWQELGQQYGFKYVYFPGDTPLDLPRSPESDRDGHFYAIPPLEPGDG